MAASWLLALCAAAVAVHGSANWNQPPKPQAGDNGVPAEFDCAMRQMALDFAQNIQPFRGKSTFERIVAELNLPGGDPGGVTQCFNLSYHGPDREFTPSFPIPSGTAYYVSPSGNDRGPGTLAQPFQTIKRALVASRSITQKGQPATIVVRDGVHYLDETISLTPDDSGLTIQNYQNEQPVISGGVRLNPQFRAAGPNVYVADLNGTNPGNVTGLRRNRNRAFRARYPNGCRAPSTPSGYACVGKTGNPLDGFGSSLLTEWVKPPKPTMDTPRIEFRPTTPFRNTSDDFQYFQLGIGGGQCEHFVPPAGYWCGNHCQGGAPAPPDCIYRVPLGLLFNKSILPNGPYKHPEDAVVQAWHPGHWASWMFQVGDGNATHLMFSKGGFQGARGSYPDRSADTFFVENVLEELDYENEYFFDARTQQLFYFTNGTISPRDIWEATNLKTLVELKGTKETPVKRVTIRGLTFRDAALTYLDAHTVPSGGDWGLGRIAAIHVFGSEDFDFDSNTLVQLDGNAMLIENYNRYATIQNNDFHEIGDNIIAQLGWTTGAPEEAFGFGPDGTEGTQPRFTRILNNIGYACGLFEKQSSFYFQARSCQNTLQNNIFFHGPRAGINFNDGFGGGSLLERNLLFNTVMESGDHGPFNSWDRQVYVTEVRDGTPSVIKAYDELRNNFFVGNYYGQEAVDNDDGSAYYETHHNVFVYGDQGMKNDFRGHDNHHHHNLYAYIKKGFGIDPQLPGHNDYFFSNRVVQVGTTGYASYDCKCSKDACPITHDNALFTPTGHMDTVCGQTIEQRAAEGIDSGTTVSAWPQPAELIAWARETLDLPPV